MNGPPPSAGDRTGRDAGWVALAGVTALAVALRALHLGSDLWLDEIVTVTLYQRHSTLEVLTDLARPNNHPLNTLLVQGARSLFGGVEWATRLPAVSFGVLSVPALYGLARFALSRAGSLAAAALLAVSVHHVAYSQSARGYAGLLFFALVATALLLDGLERPRASAGWLYALVTGVGFAAHPLMASVLASHVAVGLWSALRRGTFSAVAGWLARGFGGATVLAAALYGPSARQLWDGVSTSYLVDRIGFSPTSGAFVKELAREFTGGSLVGFVLAALLVAPLAGFGLVELWRSKPELPLALILPPVLVATALAAAGGTLYPRFLLVGLAAAIVIAVACASAAGRLLAGRTRGGPTGLEKGALMALVAAVLTVQAPLLKRYYTTPKQSYRAALRYLSGPLAEGRPVIVADVAVSGFRYYAARLGEEIPGGLILAREDADVEAALGRHQTPGALLVTTFEESLPQRAPRLAARLKRDWREDRVFPATVAGGEIRVWRQFSPGGAEAR